MQSKLPDLNHYWFKYHDYGIQCINTRNYSGIVASIYNINALLPDEYRVEIDTEKYTELMRTKVSVVCEKCKTETNRYEVRFIEDLLPFLEQIIVGSKTIKVWICPNCNNKTNLNDTKMIEELHKSPFYHKIIPEAPPRGVGLLARTDFHNKVVKWFFNSLEELDHQLGLYRKEYEPEGERDDIAEGDEYAD